MSYYQITFPVPVRMDRCYWIISSGKINDHKKYFLSHAFGIFQGFSDIGVDHLPQIVVFGSLNPKLMWMSPEINFTQLEDGLCKSPLRKTICMVVFTLYSFECFNNIFIIVHSSNYLHYFFLFFFSVGIMSGVITPMKDIDQRRKIFATLRNALDDLYLFCSQSIWNLVLILGLTFTVRQRGILGLNRKSFPFNISLIIIICFYLNHLFAERHNLLFCVLFLAA